MKNMTLKRFKPAVRIGPYEIGPDRPPLIVAEIGGNHGGDPDLARLMIAAVAEAGAEAVKFQAYRTASFLGRLSRYYAELAAEELGFQDLIELADYARGKGLIFLSSVFDFESLELMKKIDPPALKIASGDLNNFPLLEAAAALGRPLILSTGAADLEEIDRTLAFLADRGAAEVVLLQCTALYPCPDEQVNLRVIPSLFRRYRVPVGFSDHSLGVEIPLGAVTLGAALVEKHFTIDKTLPGGDNEMSCLPEELAAIVQGARRLSLARGSDQKKVTAGEKEVRRAIRRSVTAAGPIRAGQVLQRNHLALKRPAETGLDPREFFALLGRTTAVDLAADDPLTWDKVV